MSLRLAAYHEAGHAVMIIALVRKNISAEIKTLSDGSVIGHSYCDAAIIDGLKPDQRKEELLALIKISLAGLVAESIFCPNDYTPFLSGRDQDNLDEYLRHLGPEIRVHDLQDEVRKILLMPDNKKLIRYVARTLVHSGKIQ
jgi:ATP-dependent Zn protease